MNVNDLADFRYLDPFDLGDQERTLTITAIKREAVERPGGEKEAKGVLYFQGARKGLILSRPNLKTLARLYGPETDGWAGKAVVLYVEHGVKAFGKEHDVVRIRPTVPPLPQAKTSAEIARDTRALYGDDPDAERND